MTGDLGSMRERLVVQVNTPAAVSVSSLTRSSTTATVTTAAPHGYATGDYVTHAGAAQTAYNVKAKITVTGLTTYTFAVSGAPATPATGTVTATYVSNAQGGRELGWRTLDSVAAQMIPIGTAERLQLAAVQSIARYRFRIRARQDLSPAQRILWTPSWMAAAGRTTLQIAGILPDVRDRQFMFLDAGEVA